MTTATLQRYRCGSGCLFVEADLINVRKPDNGRGHYVVASGPCPKCGACGHVAYAELGPADRTNTYSVVGVKATLVPKVRCAARCMDATSLECNCSCGGERHGRASA